MDGPHRKCSQLLFFSCFLIWKLLLNGGELLRSDISILMGVCLIGPLAIFIGGSVIAASRDPEGMSEPLDERDRSYIRRSGGAAHGISGLLIPGLLGFSIVRPLSAEFMLVYLTGSVIVSGLVEGIVRLRYYRAGV